MKIFRFVDAHKKLGYVKVDDCDAHILRGQVWQLKAGKYRFLRRYIDSAEVNFGKYILGHPQDGNALLHRNGDSLDYRRANLYVMDKKDWQKMTGTLATALAVTAHAGRFQCGHAKRGNTATHGQCSICQNEASKRSYGAKRLRASENLDGDA